MNSRWTLAKTTMIATILALKSKNKAHRYIQMTAKKLSLTMMRYLDSRATVSARGAVHLKT
jgi:hypothetical protein